MEEAKCQELIESMTSVIIKLEDLRYELPKNIESMELAEEMTTNVKRAVGSLYEVYDRLIDIDF